MYAVIETGGKQYRVEVGTELEVELLDVEPGKTITLERVLLVADGADSSIGRPLVAGAEVSAEVVRQTRGEKLISFKYRPKARSRVKKGHRQELTVLRISDITLGGKSAATSAKQGPGRGQDRAAAHRGGRRGPGRQGCRAGRQAGRWSLRQGDGRCHGEAGDQEQGRVEGRRPRPHPPNPRSRRPRRRRRHPRRLPPRPPRPRSAAGRRPPPRPTAEAAKAEPPKRVRAAKKDEA